MCSFLQAFFKKQCIPDFNEIYGYLSKYWLFGFLKIMTVFVVSFNKINILLPTWAH